MKRLQLTLAGADLSGQGAVTFDTSQGMPMPLGAVDRRLVHHHGGPRRAARGNGVEAGGGRVSNNFV